MPHGFLGHYLTLHTSDPGASDVAANAPAWSRMAGETITHMALWDAPTGGQRVNMVWAIRDGLAVRVASADDLRRMHQQYRARQVARRRRGRRS